MGQLMEMVVVVTMMMMVVMTGDQRWIAKMGLGKARHLPAQLARGQGATDSPTSARGEKKVGTKG